MIFAIAVGIIALTLSAINMKYNPSWHVIVIIVLSVISCIVAYLHPIVTVLLSVVVIGIALLHLFVHRQPNLPELHQTISNHLDSWIIGLSTVSLVFSSYQVYKHHAANLENTNVNDEKKNVDLTIFPATEGHNIPELMNRLFEEQILRQEFPALDNLYVDNVLNLSECYLNRYKFPQWVKTHTDSDFKATRVFFPLGYEPYDVIKLTMCREPTNIANPSPSRPRGIQYHKTKLEENFGYRQGVYKGPNESPQIAIYTHADVKPVKPPYIIEGPRVHLLNLIGLAFDDEQQPDWQLYEKYINLKTDGYNDEDALERSGIEPYYRQMWSYVIECIKMLESQQKIDIRLVTFYNVGGGAFRGRLSRNIFNKMTMRAFQPTREYLEKANITIDGGQLSEDHSEITEAGNIPDKVFDVYDTHGQEGLDHILFINAWDPWSILGNGNSGDDSLEGFWGRSSNISILGWPFTNKDMQYVPCPNVNAED